MSLLTDDNSLHFATAIDNSGLNKGAANAQGILRNLSQNITKMDVFAGLAIGGVFAFEKIASTAFESSKKYQTSMLEIKTISKAVQDDFEGMSDAILKVGLDVPQTADELAKAYYQIASAGYDGQEGLTLLDVAAKAAVGGITDVETAADGITTALNAWQQSAGNAEGITDKLFQTVKLGKTTFPELSNNLSQVASIAASSGISLDEVLAGVASLTKQGVPTSQAFTQIKSAIISTNEVLGDGWTKSMTLQEGLIAVSDAAGGSQTELKDLVGRVEAMNAVLALTGDNAKGAAEDLLAISDSAGSAGEAFDTMVVSAENQSKLLAANIEAAFKPLGDFLVKNFTDVTSFLNQAFESGDIEKFAKTVGIAVSALAAYKTATVLSSISVMDLKRALVVARKAMQGLNIVSKLNPWGLVAAGVVAATAAFIAFRKQSNATEKSLFALTKAGQAYTKNLEEVKTKSDILFTALKNTNKGTEDRKRAVEEVNKQYGKYLPHLLTENSSLKDILTAQEAVNKALLRNVAIKAKSEELTAIAEKQIQVEKNLYKLRVRLLQSDSKASAEAVSRLKAVAKSMADLGQTSNDEITLMSTNLSKMFGLYDSNMGPVKDLLQQYVSLYTEVNSSTRAVQEFYDNLLTETPDIQPTTPTTKDIKGKQKVRGWTEETGEELKARKAIIDTQKEQINLQNIYTDAVTVSKDEIEKIEINWENVGSLMMDFSNALSLMSDSIGEVNSGLGETLGTIADIGMNVGSLIQGIATGNYLQAAVAGVRLITSMFNGEKRRQEQQERTTNEIERQNKELDAQLKILEKARGTDTLKEYQKSLQEIQQSLQEIDEKEKETVTNFWGKSTAKYDNKELLQQYQELLDKQAELRDEMYESLTGTTSNAITDEILQGFANGKTAAEDFASTFEDLMTNAMLESFKTKYLEKQFDDFYEAFGQASESGGGLTKAEMEELKQQFNRDIQNAQEGFDSFNELFESTFGTGINSTSTQAQGMVGEIKASLTEETGTVLAGTLNSIRLYVAEQVNALEEINNHLLIIAANTAYNKELERLENIENLLAEQGQSLRSIGA